MLEVEEVSSTVGFESLGGTWNELSEGLATPLLATSFAFAYTYWKNRGSGNNLLVLVAKEDGVPVGIAPLMSSTVRLGPLRAKKVSFLLPRYLECDFIVKEARRQEFIPVVVEHLLRRSGCDYMEFSGIPERSESTPILQATASQAGLSFSRKLHSAGRYVPITGTWESFLDSHSQSFRKDLRYYERRLMRKGSLETVRLKGSADQAELRGLLGAVDGHSWKDEWASRPQNRGLINDLLLECAKRGWLDAFFLELDGVPISYLCLVRYGGKAYAIFTSYSEQHAHDSPGLVCFGRVMQLLFKDHDVHEVDFMSNYEYLQRWTSQQRERYIITLTPGGPSGSLLRLGRWTLHRTRGEA